MFHYLRRELRNKLMRVVQEALAHEREEQRKQMDQAVERVLSAVRNVEVRDRRDLFAASEREAVASSARFVGEHMPTAPTFGHPHATLRHGLSLAPSAGMALEFGVYTGTTLQIIAEARGGRDVYGFDSFEGLPESWRSGFPAGAFGVDAVPDVPGAELVAGWFDKTLPGFLADHPGEVTFLHIDADLYSSAVTVLEYVGPRLVPGSVVVFDEYFNFPGWQDHEHRAWSEFCRDTGTRFRFEGYTRNNEQVVVRILGDT